MSVPRNVTREAMYVQIVDGENKPIYTNVTASVGKVLPYKAPRGLLALRVTDAMVGLSLTALTKKNASRLAEAPLAFPLASLAHLERKSKSYTPEPGQLIIIHKATEYRFDLMVTDGVARVVFDGPEDPQIDLEPFGLKLEGFLQSPKVNRMIGINFMGHTGKPGTTSSLTHAVAMVLKAFTLLPDFRILTGVDAIDIPREARAQKPVAPARGMGVDRNVSRVITVTMFKDNPDGEATYLAEVPVTVTVDLDSANVSISHLLLHHTTVDEFAEILPLYKKVLDSAVTAYLAADLSTEIIEEMVYEVVLGELDDKRVNLVREALDTVPALMVTPHQFHPPVAA